MNLRRFLTASCALTAILFFAQVSTGFAQSAPADPRWQPWLGCWTAARTDMQLMSSAPKDVCVIPAGASAVDIVNVVAGRITERTHIDASGAQLPILHEGCNGWQRAHWSGDERRVYLRSEYACGNTGKHVANGMLAMSPKGEWLDVQGIGPAENQLVRVVRYREMSNVSSMPQEITTALQRVPANSAARWAALAPIDISDVLEASRNVDAPIVEAWIAERGQRFTMDAKQLVKLAKAGVPTRIIDVLVAVSYPNVFAINHNSHTSDFRVSEPSQETTLDAQRIVYAGNMYYDPFGYSGYDNYYGSQYGYNGYGYNGYGYSPNRNGYGHSPYNYGYGPQIVIVRVPEGTGTGTEETAPHGRVVKGRGYHRGESSSDSGESSSSSSGSSSSASSGRSPTSSSGSSTSSSGSSGSGSSSGSSGRTAKPRDN